MGNGCGAGQEMLSSENLGQKIKKHNGGTCGGNCAGKLCNGNRGFHGKMVGGGKFKGEAEVT